MESQRSSDGKVSRDYSTAAPYIIPIQMMDQSKNLRTMIYKDKSHNDSRVSFVDRYLIKSRYENGSDTATGYELRQGLKPKISNKLHLQLPKKESIQVKRYVGEQKQIQQKVLGWFSRIFKCCVDPKVQKDNQQCDYCQHKYSKQRDMHQQQQQQSNNRYQTQPYISYKRLSQRQKQPIQVFYQEIANQNIINNRFQQQHIHQTNINKSQKIKKNI